ncbi:MAG: LPS-assembly protein LptD [Spirochaetaceae bacterium]|nr:LPS-assembly protein LptD [Spirochaetaceae bacterium]
MVIPFAQATAQETAAGEGANAATQTQAAAPENTTTDEAPPEAEPELTEEEKQALKEKQDRDRLLELDIKTSTLIELADWSKELGLGEGGSREDIATRIRGHYELTAPEPKEWERIITIENARTTEYFTLESVDEEYARLSGGVTINLKDGDAIHKIQAWEILFNRTRNVVSAQGGVVYNKEEGGSIEKFTGESIIINLDTWVGSFIDTISERSISSADTAYRFAGQVISKTDSETTVLKNARVTNAKTEEPFWSLNASRIWLFPGSDWAIVNAVLKVGEIPVFYLPFFVYPADDVIFHPVLGSRTRHGLYVQTTTYLLGRGSTDPLKANSISKILGTGDGMEKIREGLFLRSTGKKETRPNDKTASLLLDAYSKLGFYTGVDLNMPNLIFLRTFKFSAGFGWTRTLYRYGNFFTPYEIDLPEWESDWNHSYFFGREVPFRYRFNIATSTSGRFGSFELKFPLYSDPFIDDDLYLYRAEQIDWMRLLKGGSLDDLEQTTPTVIGSYQWNLTMRPNISTKFFDPYVSTLAINTISTFLSFVPSRDMSRDNISDIRMQFSPERQFFIPDKYTLYAISSSIAGTPVSINSDAKIKQTPTEALANIGTPIPPWEDQTAQKSPITPGTTGTPKESPFEFSLKPPTLAQSWMLSRNNALKFSFNYNLNPSSATEIQYYTKKFSTTEKGTAKDIDWSDFQSILTNFRTDGSTSFMLSEANNNLFTTTVGLSGSYQWQGHSYISEKLTPTEKSALLLTDYRGQIWSISSNYNFTLNPFYWSPVWKSTNFQYSLNSLVARSSFDEQKYNTDKIIHSGIVNYEPDPSWKLVHLDWTREFISTHRLTANFGANIRDKMQNISFYTDMPPLYRSFSTNATARVWFLESNANIILQEDTDENKIAARASAEKKYHYLYGYIFRPLYLTQTFNFGNSRSARFYTVWDPELDQWTNITATLAYGTFNTSYTAVRMFKYYYDNTKGKEGWKQESTATGGEQKLYSRDFTLSWAPSYKSAPFFHDMFTFAFNTRSSITIDLQRYTYSKFSFNMGITLGIKKFLDFSMSATSENAEIYRYIQDLPFFDDLRSKIEVGAGKENNVLLDLINSFRFDDEELRRQSGFKLKSFTFSAVHHLGDWDASISVSLSPYLDSPAGSSPSQWQYKFRTTFSFLVRWLPITEVETRVDYENEKFFRKAS